MEKVNSRARWVKDEREREREALAAGLTDLRARPLASADYRADCGHGHYGRDLYADKTAAAAAAHTSPGSHSKSAESLWSAKKRH